MLRFHRRCLFVHNPLIVRVLFFKRCKSSLLKLTSCHVVCVCVTFCEVIIGREKRSTIIFIVMHEWISTDLSRSTRFTLLFLVRSWLFEALPDRVFYACDAFRYTTNRTTCSHFLRKTWKSTFCRTHNKLVDTVPCERTAERTLDLQVQRVSNNNRHWCGRRGSKRTPKSFDLVEIWAKSLKTFTKSLKI